MDLQGSRMGWLAVSLGFGMSFGVVIFMFGKSRTNWPAWCACLRLSPAALLWLRDRETQLVTQGQCHTVPACSMLLRTLHAGYISAHLNPATCLALWVIGKVR